MVAVARATLPPAVAERWIELRRPAIRLRRAESSERPAAQLGGSPALPHGMVWPGLAAGEPLRFVAGIDFGQLPIGWLDVPLPVDGTLLLFYLDSEDPLEDWDEVTQAVAGSLPDLQPTGPGLIYVPAGTATTLQSAPPGTLTYRPVQLAGEQIVTGPDWEHPALAQALVGVSDADQAFMDNPFNSDPFRIGMSETIGRRGHRLGGYADPVQGSVEVEVAHGRGVSYSDPALFDEARQWTSLVQIDSDDDAGMMWGDCGCLYWLMRPDDIGARRFDAAEFTFQCF
jgi:uncharacterized protein YwqG